MRMTAEECISDAIVIARSRVLRKDAYSVFLYIALYPALPLLPFSPARSGLLSFLVLSLRYIPEIYGLFARNARRRRERKEGVGSINRCS